MTQYERVPLREPDWGRATTDEGRAFLSRWLALMPARLIHLSAVTDIDWIYPCATGRWLSSLQSCCSWIDKQPLWKRVAEAGANVRIEVLKPEHADHLLAVEKGLQKEPIWLPTKLGTSVCMDLAMLIGEFYRLRFPWLSWQVETRKRDLFCSQPCVGRFARDGKDTVPVLQVAYTSLARGHEDAMGTFAELKRYFDYMMERVAVPPDRV